MWKLTQRVLLKLQDSFLRAGVTSPELLVSSGGFDSIARLLISVEGERAVRLLRWGGATVGSGVRVAPGLVVWNHGGKFSHLTVGESCHIGAQVLLDLARPIVVGDRVTISMRVTILTHTDVGSSRCGIPASSARVCIHSDAYVGAGATILEGVTIGAGAVIAAGALVNRDVAANTVVAGVPAKVVRTSTAGLGASDLRTGSNGSGNTYE